MGKQDLINQTVMVSLNGLGHFPNVLQILIGNPRQHLEELIYSCIEKHIETVFAQFRVRKLF